YFYILGIFGWIWEAFFKTSDAGHFVVLKTLVKLPAILADLGVGVLLYAMARRFASATIALGTAALYLLNPAIIYNSAIFGQVDSISAGFALLAVFLLFRSDDGAPDKPSWYLVFAWVALAYSLLIKPQAAVVLPLFLAYPWVDASRRRARLIATGIGLVAALVLAVGLTEPFHPGSPIEALLWLLERYAYGSSVYAYNTVNAFNLWAIRGPFWQPDSNPILFFPQSVWGLGLVIAAVALVVWRYVQDRSQRAFLEGCAIATLAFFILATRMHERYIFDGVLFSIACVPLAKRYLWGAIALSAVLYANLQYAIQYLSAVTNHTPGADTSNLWGLGTTFFAVVAVGTFFVLGYLFLGTSPAAEKQDDGVAPASQPQPASVAGIDVSAMTQARNWFDPREGLTGLKAPLDYVIMAAFGVGNFILSFIGYWWPPDKVFDEIYFARAGEEYLQNLRIYENTHPPLTKLLVTFSIMLFGGMPHGHGLGGWQGLNAIIGHMPDGDNSYGWRFVDIIFSSLVVMLLFAFAKRITGSTLFAAIAALFLTADGMHFVQSRIATPEGIVIFFATAAVYAFYRFWISSQVGERQHVDVPEWGFAAATSASLAAGVVVAMLMKFLWQFDVPSTIVTAAYFSCGFYLLARYVLMPRFWGDAKRELTYAEGSRALAGDGTMLLYAADGGTVDDRGKIQRGARSQNEKGTLAYHDGDLTIEYARDASVTYETPEGSATYANDTVKAENGSESGHSSKLWLILFTVALGCLVSSKWYGVMGFGVSFLVLILIFLQRYFTRRRPVLWGNPRGFRIDGALMTILFVSATVYALVWMPDLLRHGKDEIANFNDVVNRQYTMYEYHENLVATHPYSSKWWEWPLDYVPVAYYYQDHRKNQSDENGCCVYEITSMPNPLILWFGLLTVPWVGVLAWRYRNKGYALIVLTYLMQWIPWAKSPRITFAYHFYVDIPLICLCNAIVLQQVWKWASQREDDGGKWLGGIAVGAYVLAVVGAFIFFYPILAAYPISWHDWHQRMWIDKWVLGPG
ncbi:MAG TPA: phospholipid carrier-dependent glycosyltransferase, partial [Candidatus Acidoferrales bacterium]|nr:phospholipid carrier-dependent glycosyltransferase [Candidatus Acidoferrales bacterium]